MEGETVVVPTVETVENATIVAEAAERGSENAAQQSEAAAAVATTAAVAAIDAAQTLEDQQLEDEEWLERRLTRLEESVNSLPQSLRLMVTELFSPLVTTIQEMAAKLTPPPLTVVEVPTPTTSQSEEAVSPVVETEAPPQERKKKYRRI